MKKFLLAALIPMIALLLIKPLSGQGSKKEDKSMHSDTAKGKIKVFNVRKGEIEEVDVVVKTNEQWKSELSPDAYHITRKHGTEPAFSGDLLKNKEEGVYKCVACGIDLFPSETKFESGTGWPSFYQPVNENNIAEKEDNSLFMRRTEVHCPRCGAHLGHVFPDGPAPTGLRYCINSAALKFEEK